MDSALESFLKKHKVRDSQDAATVKRRQTKQKQFAQADQLANTVARKREELETRSALFNAGPMTVSGSGVHTQPAHDHTASELKNINPGLVQQRALEIKRRAPTKEEHHHLRTHQLLETINETMRAAHRFGPPRSVESEPTIIGEEDRGRSRSRRSGSSRSSFSPNSREGSVSSVSRGSGVLPPFNARQRKRVKKETVQAGLSKYPEEIQRLHGKYVHLPTIERDLLTDWPMEDIAKREKLVIRRRREGMARGSARTSATKEMKKVRENRERAKRGEPPIPPTPRGAAASGSAA